MHEPIKSGKFKKIKNKLKITKYKQWQKDIWPIKKSKYVINFKGKTQNIYETEINTCSKLWKVSKRVYCFGKSNALISLKEHHPNIGSGPKCCLINTPKNEKWS